MQTSKMDCFNALMFLWTPLPKLALLSTRCFTGASLCMLRQNNVAESKTGFIRFKQLPFPQDSTFRLLLLPGNFFCGFFLYSTRRREPWKSCCFNRHVFFNRIFGFVGLSGQFPIIQSKNRPLIDPNPVRRKPHTSPPMWAALSTPVEVKP